MLCRCDGGPSIYRGVQAPEPLMTICVELSGENPRAIAIPHEIAESNDFHLLKDIGVSQEEAFREVDKPFWRR